MTGPDDNYNLRRMEHYVTLAWDSGATPVILLNKADLCDTVDERVAEVEAIAMGVPVHAISAQLGDVGRLASYLEPGTTSAFVGSSGAGKSTLVNCLVGKEAMETGGIRSIDGCGRHTTTHRELIFTQSGGLLLDIPGLRELQMWGDDDGLSESFQDLEELAGLCRFKDCKHGSEPGCEAQAAIQRGELDQKRLANYEKLQREYARADKSARSCRMEKVNKKRFAKHVRRMTRGRPGYDERQRRSRNLDFSTLLCRGVDPVQHLLHHQPMLSRGHRRFVVEDVVDKIAKFDAKGVSLGAAGKPIWPDVDHVVVEIAEDAWRIEAGSSALAHEGEAELAVLDVGDETGFDVQGRTVGEADLADGEILHRVRLVVPVGPLRHR